MRRRTVDGEGEVLGSALDDGDGCGVRGAREDCHMVRDSGGRRRTRRVLRHGLTTRRLDRRRERRRRRGGYADAVEMNVVEPNRILRAFLSGLHPELLEARRRRRPPELRPPMSLSEDKK